MASTSMESQKHFMPPPGLDRSTPREVRLRAAGRAVLVVAFALFLGAAIVFGLLLRKAVTRQDVPIWLPVLVAGALSAPAFACAAHLQFERDLLARGRAAPAVVTKTSTHRSSHGGPQDTSTYEFPVLSGARASGRMKTPKKSVVVGATICVLYDPDRPARNKPYPLALVRPAATARLR